MSYKALYRKYRPHSFETVVGQRHIIKTLQNALQQHKMSHAYLFCGPRGTGKTTVAKLVAKSLNCIGTSKVPCNECVHCLSIKQGNHPDVIEIDAASNNGVDQIRDLIEKVKYAPLEGKYKIYIIDEVHMLSQGAFNALLKTLEEPPSHVVFILATTEPNKVLPTIISRCQRFDFNRVNSKDIQERIEEVLDQEKIKYDHEATRLISQLADGGVRDALSILEQCIAYSEDQITVQQVNEIYGIATTQDKLRLLMDVLKQDVAMLMSDIEAITQKHIDIRRLTNEMMDLLKEAVIYDYTKDEKLLIKLNKAEAIELNRIPSLVALEMITDLMETADKYRSASNVLSYFEIGLLKLMGRLDKDTKIAHRSELVDTKEMVSVVKNSPNKSKAVEDKPIIPDKTMELETQIEDSSTTLSEPLSEQKQEETVIKPNQSEKSVKSSTNLAVDYILKLMVMADKQKRLDDASKWMGVKEYTTDPQFMRIANWLNQSEIKMSGEEFIVVVVKEESLLKEINNDKLIEKNGEFARNILGRRARILAVGEKEFSLASKEFVRLKEINQLPEKMIVPFFKEEKTKVDKQETKVERLNAVFGEGLFETVD
jgi:DNA polymerase-3 subunit gamma/tau